jgi:hypothetical protein
VARQRHFNDEELENSIAKLQGNIEKQIRVLIKEDFETQPCNISVGVSYLVQRASEL